MNLWSRLILSYISESEREGFEPSVPRKEYYGFRDRPIQPLWHLSIERSS